MKVAYQGTKGAFSHEACLQFLPAYEPVAVRAFGEVIARVRSNAAERGILPVSNNEAGETGAAALIAQSGLQVIEQRLLPVRMHLLGLPGATLDQIRTVVSHPVALRQCARSLALLGVAVEETSNTAIAARDLTNPARAVLASEAAAGLYGLEILKRDMHDRADNATLFAILAQAAA